MSNAQPLDILLLLALVAGLVPLAMYAACIISWGLAKVGVIGSGLLFLAGMSPVILAWLG